MLFNKNCVAFAASSAKNAGITALFNSPICTSATFNNLRTLSIALKMDEKNKIAMYARIPANRMKSKIKSTRRNESEKLYFMEFSCSSSPFKRLSTTTSRYKSGTSGAKILRYAPASRLL